jgi:hypothetical protein
MNISALLFLGLLTAGSGLSQAVYSPECGVFRNGWLLRPSPEGELRDLYWAAQGYTESWMTLRLSSNSSSRGPATPGMSMVLSVCFKGRTMPTPQKTAQVRFQMDPRVVIADQKVVPEVFIALDGLQRRTLAGPGLPASRDYPPGCGTGDGCGYSAVIIDLAVSELEVWSRAHSITGSVSGLAFELSAQQIQSLSRFVAYMTGARANRK